MLIKEESSLKKKKLISRLLGASKIQVGNMKFRALPPIALVDSALRF